MALASLGQISYREFQFEWLRRREWTPPHSEKFCWLCEMAQIKHFLLSFSTNDEHEPNERVSEPARERE